MPDVESQLTESETAHDIDAQETSPLLEGNQKNARGRKHFTVLKIFMQFLLLANLLWAITLFIDEIASLGFENVHGSGFEVLVLTTLGSLALGNTLAFFKHQNRISYILNLLAFVLLIFDIAVISLVGPLRHRIGRSMVFWGVGGAAITFLACVASNTIIERVNEEQNEQEQNNTFSHFFANGILAIINVWSQALIFLAVMLVSVNFAFDAFDTRSPPLGQIIPVNFDVNSSYRINDDGFAMMRIACLPGGDPEGPIAIVETGESSADEFASWMLRAKNLKQVCYWDRPGFGYSDCVRSPASMNDIMGYFDKALTQLIPNFSDEPLLLVSHGIGSLYSRIYAARRKPQVKGLMLVDPLHEQLFYEQENILLGFKEFWRGVGAVFGLQKLHGLFTGAGSSTDRLIGDLEKAQSRTHKSLLQQQISASRQSRIDIEQSAGKLPKDLPLLLVSSANMCKASKRWAEAQHLLLRLSDNSLAWKVLEGPHELWRNSKTSDELVWQLESFAKYIKN